MEQRISAIIGNAGLRIAGGASDKPDPYSEQLTREARLYCLATQVYLERLGRGMERASDKVRVLLDEAFALLETMGRCQHPWPLFVVGLEARDEEERTLMIEVMARALDRRPPGNLALTRRMVQAAWVQRDLSSLEADGEANLMLMYNTVISANRLPPSFT